MKTTPLTEKHIALGARMAAFAGYNMPISYSSIKEEHHAVRNSVGIFDVSHMGEFVIKGKEALDLIQYVTSNDASKLEVGEAQYSCMPNNRGGIVDDLLIYRLSEDQCSDGERAYMLVVNAANIKKDWNWIKKHNSFDTRMIDISSNSSLIAVQGPNAAKALQALTAIDLSSLKYYTFTKGTFATIDNVLISATGYTGSGGFELYMDNQHAAHIWDAVLDAGKEFDIQPAGLGARDTLRLEMGYCLYGNDINQYTSPIAAGLSWITKLDKEDFVGKETLVNQKAKGIRKKLIGFKVEDRRVPRHDYLIENEAGKVIGKVTSGTQSPSLDCPIGLGYVEKAYAKKGSTIFISTGKKQLKATVTRPPFVKV